jgi:hypothetical protein
MRECVDCTLYVYSMAEVHIEESTELQFACFNGGYPEHEAHLRECNLFPPENNFWHCVYDHNPPEENEDPHWKLLPEHECEEWFPAEKCDPVVPITVANTTTGVSNDHQVGEAFGMEQMKHDAQNAQVAETKTFSQKKKSISPASTSATKVIASAVTESKGAVTQEFTFEQMVQADTQTQEKQVKQKSPMQATPSTNHPVANKQVRIENPVTPLPERYLSDEDEEKVNQMGIEIALLVASARAKGIDVTVWLSESAPNHIVPVSDFNNRFISLGLAVGIQEDFETKREIDFATSASCLTSIATICSAGFNSQGEPLVNVHMFLLLTQAKVDRFLLQQGQVEEEDDEEDVSISVEIEAEYETSQNESIPEPVQEPVPEGVDQGDADMEEDSISPTILVSAEEPISSSQGKKSLTLTSRSNSAPPRQRKSVSNSDSRSCLHLRSSARLLFEATTLEELLIATLKQADLYHIVQVHLGYIKPYIMNLARGSVVVSSPRRWISVYDIEKAFSAARLHLTNAQIHEIMRKVNEFATKTGLDPIRTVDNEKEQDALEVALKTNSVVLNQRVSAVWLKRYFVHLKLGENACDWVTWLDTKLTNTEYRRSMKASPSDRSREFRKALAGMPHTLGEKETHDVLQNFEILTPEVLEKIVQHRLDNWELDTSGRRDFHHVLNVQFRRWSNENPSEIAGKSKKAVLEIEMKAKKSISQRLLREKRQELIASEKKNAQITIDIFMKFDAENKRDDYSTAKKFGDWLEKYMVNEAKHLKEFRADVQNRNKSFGTRLKKESWLGSLNHIESLATKVIQTLPSPLQHERRKSLIAMRRQIVNDSRALKESKEKKSNHLLVSRKNFNKYFDETFLSKIEQQQNFESKGESTVVFFKQREDALKFAHQFDKKCADERKENYQQWLEKTNEQKKKEESDRNKENQLKKEAEEKKSAKAGKIYKKWVRLHKSNKYFSKSEKKSKAIPSVLRASHDQGWRAEVQEPFPVDDML